MTRDQALHNNFRDSLENFQNRIIFSAIRKIHAIDYQSHVKEHKQHELENENYDRRERKSYIYSMWNCFGRQCFTVFRTLLHENGDNKLHSLTQSAKKLLIVFKQLEREGEKKGQKGREFSRFRLSTEVFVA